MLDIDGIAVCAGSDVDSEHGSVEKLKLESRN
jgi:hypothetical protein